MKRRKHWSLCPLQSHAKIQLFFFMVMLRNVVFLKQKWDSFFSLKICHVSYVFSHFLNLLFGFTKQASLNNIYHFKFVKPIQDNYKIESYTSANNVLFTYRQDRAFHRHKFRLSRGQHVQPSATSGIFLKNCITACVHKPPITRTIDNFEFRMSSREKGISNGFFCFKADCFTRHRRLATFLQKQLNI